MSLNWNDESFSFDMSSFSPYGQATSNQPKFKSFSELFASICDSSRLTYTPNVAWNERSDFEKIGPTKEDYSDTKKCLQK